MRQLGETVLLLAKSLNFAVLRFPVLAPSAVEPNRIALCPSLLTPW